MRKALQRCIAQRATHFYAMIACAFLIVYLVVRDPTTSLNTRGSSAGRTFISPLFSQNYGVLCVLAIFKNEGHAINEWLAHYRKEGVNAFFLIDNGSTDNFNITDMRGVTLKLDKKRHSQGELYTSFLNYLRGYQYVVVVDLDEFMFSKHGTLLEYATNIQDNVSQVLVSWSMFGSSGFDKQPESIIKSFTWRLSGLAHPVNTKYIARVSAVTSLWIHHGYFSEGGTIRDDDNLQVNHYAIQSREFFASVKMTRGAADSPDSENVRTWEYFKRYDFHDYEDTSLRDKIYAR